MNAGKFMYVFFYLDMGYLRKLVQRSAATAPDLGRGVSPLSRCLTFHILENTQYQKVSSLPKLIQK